MRHRRPTTLRSRALAVWRPLGALVLASALGSTLLAAAGGAAPRDVGLDVVQIARQQVGDAYLWGGNGPDAWDCSGLTSRLWREVGGVDDIPRVSRDQLAWTVPIPREQLLPGDLVFFGNPVGHVGIYSGTTDGVATMVDASSARKGVLERPVYKAAVVRYGRVPREGMPKVTPWTPPPPPPSASPSASPTASPTASPATSAPPRQRESATPPPPSPSASPAGSYGGPGVTPAAATVTPLRGLPAPELGVPHTLAERATANARSVTGSRHWDDVSLVRVAWQHAGGPGLPTTRAAIEKLSAPVLLTQVRRGDVVVYGSPASHLGIYLGHGYMVDASPSLGRVVVRRVFTSPTVRFVRLPAR